jgi:hypothetical protein
MARNLKDPVSGGRPMPGVVIVTDVSERYVYILRVRNAYTVTFRGEGG